MRRIRPKEGPEVKIDVLSQARVHALAHSALKKHIILSGHSDAASADKAFDVLLAASAKGSSIEQECENHVLAPSPNTVRTILRESLELARTEEDLNRVLAEHRSARSWSKPQVVAVDFHDQP
jgi:hypothetical protein